ncbi:retropepsin-like aspartic protease family protein [Catenovulum sediminis]|uniref:Retropepsin-like aspartic protease n=1 Tax=Catenovulum sediminis TaxID=1740262 RepID=A0ABV1RJU1_9ALTE|nr:retropepsin-like aspartic protease [Catenovulum sediminis]
MDPDYSQKTGKIMSYAAWIIAFFLLTYFFEGYLNKKENPNQNPESYYTNQGAIEVKLERNQHGHYVTNGKINQQIVTFLLDTGATNVSVPENIAKRLNLPYGPSQRVGTANGSINVYQTRIDVLEIGDIKLRNVAANINPYMQGEQILLGMSVLKRIEFTQRGSTLTLKQY